jgi:hypothetical protein
MAKPKVIIRCAASHYDSPNERTIEYHDRETNAGGLINFRRLDDGKLHVFLYRHDEEVQIHVGKGE